MFRGNRNHPLGIMTSVTNFVNATANTQQQQQPTAPQGAGLFFGYNANLTPGYPLSYSSQSYSTTNVSVSAYQTPTFK